MVFQKPGGVSAALVLKGPLLASTESHPVKSGIHSPYHGSVAPPPHFLGPGLAGGALWAVPAVSTHPQSGSQGGWRGGPSLPPLEPSLSRKSPSSWPA